MSRRKTKSERELIADIRDRSLIFCDMQGNCKSCPLTTIRELKDVDCAIAYIIYLLEKGEDNNESCMCE